MSSCNAPPGSVSPLDYCSEGNLLNKSACVATCGCYWFDGVMTTTQNGIPSIMNASCIPCFNGMANAYLGALPYVGKTCTSDPVTIGDQTVQISMTVYSLTPSATNCSGGAAASLPVTPKCATSSATVIGPATSMVRYIAVHIIQL